MKPILIILGLALAGIAATAKADPNNPSINFGYGITNTTSSVETYTFGFPMPTGALAINLPAGTYDISASFGLTLTPAPGDTETFSLPNGASNFLTTYINGQNTGLGIGTVTETASNGTEVFSFAPVSEQYVLTTTGLSMETLTTFNLSPGDSASFSGSFEITQVVPEPGSLALGVLAVGAFAGLVIRRRQAQA